VRSPLCDIMIEIEHLIYGSFQFDGSAQHIPAQSPGISNKIRKEITSFCDSWGECKNFKFYSSLNQIWLEDESEPKVAVIKVTHHGKDFSGRSGALLRHALVFKEKDYQKIGFDPFRVESLNILRTDWKEGDSCETLHADPARFSKVDLSLIPAELYPSLRENLSSLLKGLSLYSYRSINTLRSNSYVQGLFSLIPHSKRRTIPLTTFAFRKNHEYRIGCIYSPERIPQDDADVRFEKKAGGSQSTCEGEMILDYGKTLFSFLEQNRYVEALAYIENH
jgi:hypothetical protein